MAEFTYEDIYELLRVEKYSTDLQLVKLEDLRKVKEYFEAKRGLLAKQTKDSEFYDRTKKDKLKTELENARRALKDWYEKREKKLLSRATFTARTDFKLRDTTNMLPSEEVVYLKLLDVLKENYVGFFSNFKKGVVEEKPVESVAAVPAEQIATQAAPQIVLKKIRVRQQIPELMGPDLQTYGPFNENDVASVPEEIAALLIGQGKAEDVRDEIAAEGQQATAIEVRVSEDVKTIEQQNQTQ